MTTLHDTAEAVATLIGVGSAASAFTFTTGTPRVSYETELPLESIGIIDVSVVPASLVQVASSRITLEYTVGVDVVLRYRFGASDVDGFGSVRPTNVEAYIGFLEELTEYIATNRIPAGKTACSWMENDIQAPWVPEHMRQNRQYTGIFRATYSVEKELT